MLCPLMIQCFLLDLAVVVATPGWPFWCASRMMSVDTQCLWGSRAGRLLSYDSSNGSTRPPTLMMPFHSLVVFPPPVDLQGRRVWPLRGAWPSWRHPIRLGQRSAGTGRCSPPMNRCHQTSGGARLVSCAGRQGQPGLPLPSARSCPTSGKAHLAPLLPLGDRQRSRFSRMAQHCSSPSARPVPWAGSAALSSRRPFGWTSPPDFPQLSECFPFFPVYSFPRRAVAGLSGRRRPSRHTLSPAHLDCGRLDFQIPLSIIWLLTLSHHCHQL